MEYAQQAARAEIDTMRLNTAYAGLREIKPADFPITPEMRLFIEQDRRSRACVSGDWHRNSNRMRPTGLQPAGHRPIQERLKLIDQKLATLVAQREEELRRSQVESAHQAYRIALQTREMLHEKLDQAKESQRDLDTKLARFGSMDNRQRLLEKQYEELWPHVKKLQMLATGQETVRIYQMGQAIPR